MEFGDKTGRCKCVARCNLRIKEPERKKHRNTEKQGGIEMRYVESLIEEIMDFFEHEKRRCSEMLKNCPDGSLTCDMYKGRRRYRLTIPEGKDAEGFGDLDQVAGIVRGADTAGDMTVFGNGVFQRIVWKISNIRISLIIIV